MPAGRQGRARSCPVFFRHLNHLPSRTLTIDPSVFDDLVRDRVNLPVVWDAFQLLLTAGLQPDGGARNQVLDRARDQDFPAGRECRDPGADVNRNASDTSARTLLNLTGVQSGSDLDAQRPHPIADSLSTGDCSPRCVEDGKSSVSRRVDQASTKTFK